MSTRYVWEVYSPAVTKYIDLINHDPNSVGMGMGLDVSDIPLSDVWNYASGTAYVAAGNDYTFDESTGKYTLTGISTIGSNTNGYNYPSGGIAVRYWNLSGTQIIDQKNYVLSADRRKVYLARPGIFTPTFDQNYRNPGDEIWWGISGSKLMLFWYDESDSSPTVSGRVTAGAFLIGYRTAADASTPETFRYYVTTSTNGAPSGGSYSVRSKGTNNIQPTMVSASKNDDRVVTVQITGASGISNLTGQSLKYYVQYRINGGAWQDYNSGNAYDFTYNSSSKTITTAAQSDGVETIVG